MKKRNYLYMSLAGAGAIAAFSYQQNHKIEIQTLTYGSDLLPSSFHGFRILHISDLHDRQFGKHQRKILKQIHILQPDVIFLSGDMLDRRKTIKDTIHRNFSFIEGIIAIAPVYYVPGNHEATSCLYAQVKQFLLDVGVQVLENSKVDLSRNEESISLIGLKDPKFYCYASGRFEENLSNVRKTVDTPFCMLLSHRPEKLELYAKYGIDLAFCGHAHGGQIRLPKIGGLYAPNQGILPKYTNGCYTKDSCTMVVSRGLGNSRAPLRINNHPQLILVKLQKSLKKA